MRWPALIILAVLACRPHVRRPASDEAPYPPVDVDAIDRTASACDDFYQFACGRWVAETALPPDRGHFERGEGELEEREARQLRRLLEDAAEGKVDPRDRFGRKAGDFYAACMDEDDVEARGLAELEAEWAQVDAVEDRAALVAELARLEAMGLEVPFRLRAEPDAQAPASALLVLAPGGLSLPAPSLYLDGDPRATEARARFGEALRALFVHAGESAEDAGADALSVLAFEQALAEGRLGPAEAALAARLHPRTDREALERLAPGISWERFLRGIGAGALEAVGVADPVFLASVARLHSEVPLSGWKAYLRFGLLKAMARKRALPATLVEDLFRFERQVAGGAAEPRARWKHCVVETVSSFEVGVGEAFGRKYLRRDGRERAGALVLSIRRALAQRVAESTWMDSPTRARAAAKLEQLLALVGYGGEAPDYGAVRAQRDSYFRNLLSAGRFAVAQEVARAERPVERGEWLHSPSRTEAVYCPSRNTLVLPAGLLEPPVYNPEAPPAVVFGAIGTRIGRALVEALEGEGQLYDGTGKATDWWTPATARGFLAYASCLSEQQGSSREGEGAVLEGLADQGGLRLAFDAMRIDRALHPGLDRKLRGFSPDQQLFLGWAQTLCTAGGGEEARPKARPVRQRVNGAVSNLGEFQEAFRCGPTSQLARAAADRCSAW